MSIAEARAAWELARAAVRAGGKPQAEKLSEERLDAPTVGLIATAYLDEHVAVRRNAKSTGEAKRLFASYVFPVIGDRPADTFRVPDAVAFLTEVRGKSLASARVLRGEMRAAWRHALERGRVDTANPFSDIMKGFLPQKRRTRVLSDAELTKLLRWLPVSPHSQSVQDALRITLMTACRSGEVVALRWSDVDLRRGQFVLAKTKTGVPRTVIYPPSVGKILKRRRAEPGPFVFPSPIEGRAMRQHALVWSLSEHASVCPVKGWTAHDLRRTARTGLARLGVADDVAEAALGHSRAGVRGVYDLHAREAEVGEALRRWEKYLLTLGGT
jgi:integrase